MHEGQGSYSPSRSLFLILLIVGGAVAHACSLAGGVPAAKGQS
jgi:hypothetical protein